MTLSRLTRRRYASRAHAELRGALYGEQLEGRALLTIAPIGGEILINTTTTNNQQYPHIATDGAGNYVVAWESYGQEGADAGVYFQRYDSTGTPVGSETHVNSYTTDFQGQCDVAMSPSGTFVVTWTSKGQDGSDDGIYGQRFTASGTPAGSEFRVNTTTTDAQNDASVAMDNSGNFVVVWQSYDQDGSHYGVYAQRFNASGVKQGSEFRVNGTTTSAQGSPDVALDSDGDFIVTWTSFNTFGSNAEVYARRYNAAGTAQGGEFVVNTTTSNLQFFSDISCDDAGNFVVTWASENQDGSGNGVYAKRYNAAGTPQGSEFRVNTTTSNHQFLQNNFMLPTGEFTVAWSSLAQDGSQYGVYAQRYNATGVAQGSEFRVNTTTANNQFFPNIAMDDAGDDFFIAWSSFGQDGGGYGNYMQRYGQNNPPNSANAGGPYAVSEGNSLALSGSGTDPDGHSLTYSWDVNGDNTFGDATGATPTLTWSQLQALGINDGPTTRNVKVRVDDGYGGTLDSSAVLLTLDNAAPTAASVSGPATVNRGTPALFTLTATDPSSVDQAANFSFAIDWDGNGSVDQTHVGPTGTSLNHTFAVHGYFTVKVTATDKDGGVSSMVTTDIRVDRGSLTASGSETLANTTTASDQTAPAVSNDLFGNFVIAWVDSAKDGAGNGTGVYAKVFNNTGGTSLSEFRVNSTLGSNQDQPAVAMDQDGNFMVVWRSGQSGTNDIWGKLYSRFGTVMRDEFVVNSAYTTDNQAQPSVAVDASGNFVVVWQSNNQDGNGLGVFGQRFNAAGQAIGALFQGNVFTVGNQDRPRVDMADSGAFVVTWRSFGQDLSGQGAYARRFSAAGVALDAADIQVHTTTALDQTDPHIAVDADGDFVIAWTSSGQDGSGTGIYAQRFNAAGAMQGSEFLVNQTTANNQQISQVVTDSFGDFMIGWESNLQDGDLLGVYFRKYSANGAALTNEAQINTTTTGDQKALSLTSNYDGDMVAAWQSADASGQGVYFQRYSFVGYGNTPPVGSAGGPYTLVEGHTLSVTGAGSSDINGDVLSYRWDINGDGAYGDLVGKTPVVTWPQLRALGLMNLNNFPQTFNVTVRVNDGTSVVTSAATTLNLQAFPSLGTETQVNTTTAGQQDAPVIASDASGNYVVVWESPDATAKGVLARRYNADGTPAGAAFQVNTSYTSGDQFRPTVSMDASGNFVILWQSFSQDGNGFGIRGRRYNNTGTLIGSEFGVNATTFDNQVRPTVKLRADGSFVAAWQSYGQDGDQHGIFGRLFDSSNAPLTGELAVNTFTTGFQEFPKVAADSSGNFVIVWTSGGNQDSNGQAIIGRRFNANGTANGGEFQVNTLVLGNQFKPSVAMDDAGNFVVAWSDSNSDGNANGIFARRYDSTGTAVDATEFQVNTYNVGLQQGSAVSISPTGGDFIITYESFGQDSSDFGIYARQYDFTNGPTFTGEFRVNTTTANAQTASAVAVDPTGQYVVVWNSNLQDGDQGGIYFRRFQVEVPNFARGFAGRSSALSANAVDALAARLALEAGSDDEQNGPITRRRLRNHARVNDLALAKLLGE